MSKIEILDKIVINENVYIYRKSSGKFFAKRAVTNVFNLALNDKDDQNCKKLLSSINESKNVQSGREYMLSTLFMRYSNFPSFLSEYIDENWMEQKLAYLLLYDFSNYLIVVKRNISGIQSFINYLDEIEYEIISKILLTDDTLFEKFSTQNLDIAKESIKTQQVESEDLTENYNYLGANTFALNLMRLNNNSQRYLVSLKSSRISKTGEKKCIAEIAEWGLELINGIDGFINKDSFLDVFATPSSYVKVRDELEPISVTLMLNTLINDLTTNKITEVTYEINGLSRIVNLSKYIKESNISLELTQEDDHLYTTADDSSLLAIFKKLRIKLNPKTITISSKTISNFKVTKENGATISLTEYLNATKSYIVNFENCEYVYSNGTLFKDNHLLGNIELFLTAFIPDPALVNIKTEKGKPTVNSTQFEDDSTFRYVEDLYANNQFLLLDDLGDEWADHICLNENKITFIHSKHSSKLFSATAFTDIVGQAQKNFGNMLASDDRIRAKKDHWSKTFIFDHVISQITRLRKGKSVDDFINRYIEIKKGINPRREVVLVLDFISKQELAENLNKLKNGVGLGKRKQTIQILWFLSSLIGNCRATGIEIEIRCKP